MMKHFRLAAVAALFAALLGGYAYSQNAGEQIVTTLGGTEMWEAIEPSSPLPVAITSNNMAKYYAAHPNGVIKPITGTATVTPEQFTTGTLNTTAVAGGVEYNGSTFFDTGVGGAGFQQVRDDESYEYLTAPYTLVSQTGAQAALNTTTNGAIPVVGATVYHFQCQFSLTSLSGTSGSYGFAIGTANSASITAQYWTAQAQKGGTSVATAAASFLTMNVAANTALTTANTNTTGAFTVDGLVDVNAAGSLVPQISQGTAAAAVVGSGSGCRFWPIGTHTQFAATVGGWN